MGVTEVSTPMSLSNAEEKEWLSTVILGSLNRAIYKLKPEDRPTWAKVDVRDFLAPIVSAVVNDQAWPDVLESCRRCAAVQNLPEDESDHVLVVVEDVLAASNLPIVDSPTFVPHKLFVPSLRETTGTSEKNIGELAEIQYREIEPEKVRYHRFDVRPAVIKALRTQKKIGEQG